MNHQKSTAPDSTAVRVALWRALHLQADGLEPAKGEEYLVAGV